MMTTRPGTAGARDTLEDLSSADRRARNTQSEASPRDTQPSDHEKSESKGNGLDYS